ncbi:MAG: LPP20 family lipoprotein [Spirochaetales bacterium]|nr:LPP20 family lipoprotein [Spirochaetales bacterium]
MKRLTLILLAGIALILVASCASDQVSGLPDFVLNPPVASDAIFGVGYGKQSTFALSRTVAQTNARADIAKQVETTIQSAVISYAQEAGVDGDTQTIQFLETVTKEITDQTLSGATPVRMEQDKDGGVWVLMQYPKQALLDAAEDSFVRNEGAAFAEFKAAQAVDRLNHELENNPPQSEPVR